MGKKNKTDDVQWGTKNEDGSGRFKCLGPLTTTLCSTTTAISQTRWEF